MAISKNLGGSFFNQVEKWDHWEGDFRSIQAVKETVTPHCLLFTDSRRGAWGLRLYPSPQQDRQSTGPAAPALHSHCKKILSILSSILVSHRWCTCINILPKPKSTRNVEIHCGLSAFVLEEANWGFPSFLCPIRLLTGVLRTFLLPSLSLILMGQIVVGFSSFSQMILKAWGSPGFIFKLITSGWGKAVVRTEFPVGLSAAQTPHVLMGHIPAVLKPWPSEWNLVWRLTHEPWPWHELGVRLESWRNRWPVSLI